LSLLAISGWIFGILGICALSVVGLLVILIAPWRSVRSEHRLPRDVETRLLLGEDPDEIARRLSAQDDDPPS